MSTTLTFEELDTVRAAYQKRIEEVMAIYGEGSMEDFPRADVLIPWIEQLSLDEIHNIIALYTIPEVLKKKQAWDALFKLLEGRVEGALQGPAKES